MGIAIRSTSAQPADDVVECMVAAVWLFSCCVPDFMLKNSLLFVKPLGS
jgi:hypothetical protein